MFNLQNVNDMEGFNSTKGGFNGTILPAGGQGGGTSFEDLGYQPFDTAETYAAGDVVIYGGSLYKFTASHSGAWTGTDATETSINEQKADADKVLTKDAQPLTPAEKSQVLTNLGIDPSGQSLEGAVRYDGVQTLTDAQQQQAQDNIGVAEALAGKANIDGYYSQLTAGAAESLVGGNEASREFTEDTAGGTADIADGIVQIDRIKGNTIVWNQLFGYFGTQQKSGISITNNGDGSFTLDGTATSNNIVFGINSPNRNVSLPSGHYGLFRSIVSKGDNTSITSGSGVSSAQNNMHFNASSSIINRFGGGVNYFLINIKSGDVYDNVTYRLQCFDLTAMFGAGNEPATVAKFKKMFPLDYYNYNAGQLLSLNPSGILTDGFNQYNHSDPHINVFAQAYYIGGTYTSLWFSKSKTDTATAYAFGDVLTAGSFYTNGGTHYKANASAAAYDSSKTYAVGAYCIESSVVYKCNTAIDTAEAFDASKWTSLVDVAGMVTDGILTSVEITPVDHLFTPAEQGYVHVVGGNATNTVVNLHWSGKRDGEYESYWQSARNIPIAQINTDGTITESATGKTRLFPDGLCSVGSAYDEVTTTKAIKCIAKQTITGAIGDECTLVGCKLTATEYLAKSNIGTISNGVLTLTAAATNIDVYYELAEPIEVTFDEPLNLNYRVSDFGTETLLPINGSVPVTAPIRMDVVYGLNVVDFVRRSEENFVTIEDSIGDNGSSFTNLRSALSAAFGIDIVPTYDSDSKRYTFTIADNRKVEVPESATASGLKGTWAEDETAVYFCTDMNTWIKLNKETW